MSLEFSLQHCIRETQDFVIFEVRERVINTDVCTSPIVVLSAWDAIQMIFADERKICVE